MVFRSYVSDPQLSVRRYRLTRSVAALRDRELASVRKYDRTFSRYVRERLHGQFPEAQVSLRSDVIAATVVAAHNAVLREWLRAGGDYDPMPELEAAFDWLIHTFETARRSAQRLGDDVVVAVFRADQPIDDVVERISRSL